MRPHDLRGAGDAARAGQVLDHHRLAQRLGQAVADGADGAIGPEPADSGRMMRRAGRPGSGPAPGPRVPALQRPGSRAKAQGAAPDGRCQRGRCFAVASTGVPRAWGWKVGVVMVLSPLLL